MRYPNVHTRPPSRGAMRAAAVLFTLAFALFAAVPAAAQSAATVSVTPTPAVAGEPVTVSGYGFAPGEMVTVEFGGEVVASGFADDEGYFESLGVISASMPEGEHPLDVTGDMGSYGSIDLEVTVPPSPPPTTAPAETASPTVSFSDPVPAGTSTVVSGADFAPGELVTIEFGGVTVGHTVANDMGEWSVSITVDPGMPVGGHPIDVTGDAGSFVNGELVVSTAPPTTTLASTAGQSVAPPTSTTTSVGATDGSSTSEGSTTDGPTPDESTSGGSGDGGSSSPGGTGTELGLETPAVDRGFDRTADSTRTHTSGAGGVPWGPVGLALALLAIAGTYAATRVRKNCDPEHAAYNAADAAYDPAKRAADYYQAEYEHFRGVHTQLLGELENPLPPPRLGYYGESADDRAHAEEVFEQQQAEWEMLEQRAERARHNIDGAREAMDAARAERDEADAALAAARETLEAARVALMDCEGCAPPPRPEGETAGGATSLPPAVGSATGAPAPCLCVEGSTKLKVERTETFRVLAGDVDIDVPTSAWTGASNGGSIDPGDLGGLDSGQLEDLFSDLDNRPEAVTTGYTIPTRIITVKHVRVVVCNGGGWVETEQTNRVEESSEAPPITFRQKSKDARRTARLVGEAQAHVAELEANERAAEAAMAH